MATSYPGLKKVGQFWHYELRVNGVRLHGSTKATDIATAKKVLEAKRREALEGQYRIVSRIPTLDELFDLWHQNHQSVFSQRHLVPVECIYRKWLHPALGGVKIDQVGGPAVDAIRADVVSGGRSPRYANNILQVLRLLLNYGIKSGFIKVMPVAIRMSRVQRKPRPVLQAARVQDFFDAVDRSAKNPHVALIIRMMLGVGLRESEALGMRWEWFDLDRRTYTVGKAKGKEARILPVPDWLWALITVMPREGSEWVFPAEDGQPHRPQFCKKTLQRVCKALNLGNVTQHRLRATFASLHAEAGTTVPEIQEMLGHKNIATTMIYVESGLEAKRHAQDVLSYRLGFK